MQAALLRVKLRYLDKEIEARRKVANQYLSGITNTAITLPVVSDSFAHVWHLFVVSCEKRDKLANYLNEQGINTIVHYPIPPHHQQAYKEWQQYNLPITENLHKIVLSIPMSPVMNSSQIETTIDGINDFGC